MRNINKNGTAASSPVGVTRNRRRSPNQEQSVIVYDLISEGPIEGLINGASSIYLDTTQVLNNAYKTSHNPKQSFDVSYNASTNTITDNTGSSMFSGYNSSNGSYKVRIEEAKKTISGISITAGSKTVTSSGGFATNDVSKAYVSGQYLRIKEGGPNKTTLVCKITKYTSATSVEIDRMAEITASSLAGTIDLCGTVSSTSNANTAVITPDTGGDRTVANTAAYMDSPSSVAEYQATNFNYNFDNVTYGFKTGERSQSYVGTAADTGNASVIANISKTLTTTDLSGIGVSNNFNSYGYSTSGDETATWTANPIFITSTQMNVSTQKSAVDRLKLTFQYDNMHAIKSKNGREWPSMIEHRIYLRYKNPGDANFTEDLLYGPTDSQLLARPSNKRVHGWTYTSSGTVEAYCKNPFVEVFDINLEPYQPLEDYEIKLETITPINREHGETTHYNSGRLASIESVINDKLSYPLAAYGQMMFNASDFGNVPERGYHARGLKVMVPTNYSPNHEGYEGSPAQYTRNITTGAVGSDYVAWDGNFRGDTDVFDATSPNFEKVYSNNPAWVFYDIMTNDRYGCGEYIDASDIDKYALFKIARYCDELVPNGEGGTEPRFTANVWFTEQAEAMKVAQDMLSIFRGMMTWVNGQITIEQNRERSPIAAFNKGNVLGGSFSYQSTRNRFRYNQVNVTWNDPKAFYKKTVEIVEDYDNIVETRQIKKKDVVAFGCTSRAQAVRYGKWHLFTDQMETDVVTFQVGLEGVNLSSGDVITVADADRNNLRFGGRTLANSTTTNIKVDSSLDLSNTATFFMEVVFPEGGAYLQQDTATIRGASRKRGDFIQYANNVAGSNTALTSEAIMINAVDDSDNKLDLVWSGETRVERQEVSSYNSTSVTVASAFTSAPATHSIWAIIELDADGQMVHGSAKEYMIQNIKEDDQDPIFAISAVEYNRKKFSLVDRGYVIEDLPETTRMPRYTENVPFPTDVVLKAVPHQQESIDGTTEAPESSALDLAITWGHPSTDRTDTAGNTITNKYEFIESYEVKHNLGFTGKFKTEIIPSTETSFLLENPAQKIGTVLVRLTNTQGHFSKWIRREIDTSLMVLKIPTSTTSKIGAIATGGGLSTGLSINSSTGLASLGSTTYDFTNTVGDLISVSSGNTAQTSQVFSGVSDGGEAFVVHDFDDAADPLKAVEIKKDTTARNPNVGDNNEIVYYNFEYVSEVGAANAGLTQKTGTVSIPQYSSEVTGSGTSFTTEYEVGDRIIIDTSTTRYFATVTSIESNTKLFLDQSVPRSYSSVNIFKTSFISTNQDTVIGKVTRSGSTYTLVSFLSGGTGEDGQDGQDGEDGQDGQDGQDGTAGDRGRKIQEIILYYKQTFNNANISAPSAPSTGTYNFSTGTVASIPSGWVAVQPEFAVGSIIFKSEALALETTSLNDVSGSLTWGTPSNAFSPQNDINFIFIRSANQPTTPSITNFPIIPTGWHDDIANVPSAATPIWVVKGVTAFDTSGGAFRFRTTWQAANIIEGSNGTDGTDGTDGDPGADGDDGASNFTVFQESSSQPATPSAGTPNPPTSSWYSTLTAARNAVSGDGLVWFSVGTKPGTSNTITWSVPIRYVEDYGNLGGTKPPEDANKFTPIADSTEGRWRFSINDGSTTDVDVFSDTERTKLDNLRAGTLPGGTGSIESTTGSQSKATAAQTAAASDATTKSDAAEAAAKLQESNNRVTFPTDNTEGRFSFQIGGGTAVVNNVFSSEERTKLNNLRAGTAPGGTGSILNSGIALSSAGALTGAGGGTLDLDDINDTGTTKAGAIRANAGLNSDGDVDRAVPVGVGGTGQTNTNKFLNSGIAISQGNSGVFTLTKGDGTTDTTTITKGKLGLSYTDGADITGNNTANNVSNVGTQTVANAQQAVIAANAGLTTTGDVNRAVPTGKGGTGETNTNKFLNSDLGITLDGTNITLTKAGDTNSTDTVPTALKNSNIAINGSGQLTGIGTGVNTVISNTKIVAADIGGSGKAFAVLPASGATVGAVLGTNLKASNGTTTLGDDDVKNDSLDIDTNGTSIRIKKGSTVIQSTTLDKGSVGLTNLNSLETGSGTKLSGIATGATVGAVLGTNLKAANGTTTLGDDDVKNASLDVAISGTAIKLKIGSTETSTVSATQALVGLSGVSNNADQTSSNTAADVTNVNGTAASTVKAGAVRANAGLNSDGDVNRTVPVGVGGTGQTATNKFLNSDIGIAMDGTNVTITKAGDTNSAVAIPSTLKNSSVTLSASGILSGGGTSTQINVGSIANSPFDTSGNVDTGETITVGSKFTIDRNNERILIED